MQPLPPAGWYPDPNGSAELRWWNGQGWTADMAPVAAPAAVAGAAPFGTPVAAPVLAPTHHAVTQPYGATRPAVSGSAVQQNRFALITFGIVALYIFIAMTSHVVLLGILPLGMSMRSKQANEPLAVVAIVAAVISIVVAVTALSGH